MKKFVLKKIISKRFVSLFVAAVFAASCLNIFADTQNQTEQTAGEALLYGESCETMQKLGIMDFAGEERNETVITKKILSQDKPLTFQKPSLFTPLQKNEMCLLHSFLGI